MNRMSAWANGPDGIPVSTLRVLLTVIELHRHGPVTIRDIAAALDWHSNAYVLRCLDQLQANGLVAREPHLGGTIRPTCTVELFALTPTEEV